MGGVSVFLLWSFLSTISVAQPGLLERIFRSLASHADSGPQSLYRRPTAPYSSTAFQSGGDGLDTSGITECIYLDNEYIANILRIDYLVIHYQQHPSTPADNAAAWKAIGALELRNLQLADLMAKANGGAPCFPGKNGESLPPHPYQRSPEQIALLSKNLVTYPGCTRACQSKTEGELRSEQASRLVSMVGDCLRCTAAGPGMPAGITPSAQCGTQPDAAAAAYAACATLSSHPLQSGCTVTRCEKVTRADCSHISGDNASVDIRRDTEQYTSNTGQTVFLPVHLTGGLVVGEQQAFTLRSVIHGELRVESRGAPYCTVADTLVHAGGRITCLASKVQGKIEGQQSHVDLYGNGHVKISDQSFDTAITSKWTFETNASLDMKSVRALCAKWLEGQVKPEVEHALAEKIRSLGMYWEIKAGQCTTPEHCGNETPSNLPVCRDGRCLRLLKHGERCDKPNPDTVPFPKRVGDPGACLSGSCRQNTLKSLAPPGEPYFECFGPFLGSRRNDVKTQPAYQLIGTNPDGREVCLDRHPGLEESEKGFVYSHPCNAGEHQNVRMMVVDREGNRPYFLVVGSNGACLDMHQEDRMGPRGRGYKVYFNPDCHGGHNQQFFRAGDGSLRVRNRADLCLDVSEKPVGNGNQVYLYPCHGQPNQTWTVRSR